MKARVTLHPAYTIAHVDPRLFGGFVEHMGRSVYEGVYEPDHPTADADGCRDDVKALVRELRMPIMRYPGGNFVSGYRWEDGVGPRERRPVRLDPAWRAIEPNSFGLHEFARWCEQVGADPVMAVNLGTRGPAEAAELVEYCNFPGGTALSDLRREHGRADPWGVRTWCLGNEMDGPWQIGAKTGEEYGRTACEAGKLMKWVDPGIELIACGSSAMSMPTFGDYELATLDACFDCVDYVSTHTYYSNHRDDTTHFFSKSDEMALQIERTVALCDAVSARKRSRKRLGISFDEWNVWYHSKAQDADAPEWVVGRPILEEVYNVEDALLIGGMLITLLNHCDRVRIACLAQVVNVLGPIMTEKQGPAWRQTIFHPFALASAWARGTALRALVDSPGYENADGVQTAFLTAAAVLGSDERSLTLLVFNRSVDASIELTVCGGFTGLEPGRWVMLGDDDLKAVNSAAEPDRVAPMEIDLEAVESQARAGEHVFVLPPASWHVIRFKRS